MDVTVQLHLDDLITFGPSNDLITREHQPDPFDILLVRGRMDSGRSISTVRRDVVRGVRFILLSFRLEDLTLRLEKQGKQKEVLTSRLERKEKSSRQDKRTFLLRDNKTSS